jgi:dienelactone hydrolase
MKKLFLKAIIMFLILIAIDAQAKVPKISNLQFLDNPTTLQEWYTISFEFEGEVDKLYLESTWDSPAGETNQEVKEFFIKPEIKEKPHGLIRFKWKSDNSNAKPSPIIKIWVKDTAGNQSNVLSEEVQILKPILEEEVKIPIKINTIFGTKTLNLSATIYRPGMDGKFPLLVLNHGSPMNEQERRNMEKFRNQSMILVRKGFVIAVPMRRGYGTSEGEYAEHGGNCDNYDYDHVAKEAVKDIEATVQFMKQRTYVDGEKKIVMVGQSSGGFSSLAYGASHANDVAAIINFAGGKVRPQQNKVCSEDRLVETMSNFGKTSRMPTLWIYIEQDLYAPPKLYKKIFEIYRKKGGQGEFILLSSEYGHYFFKRELKVWQPIVEEFLKEVRS